MILRCKIYPVNLPRGVSSSYFGRGVGSMKNSIRVAIVGRPNVGKSSLFNKLLGERKAIVHDLPGVTRDRVTGELKWEGAKFLISDTGGYVPGDDPITKGVNQQTSGAIEEADIVLFVVNSKEGLLPFDFEIANTLRKFQKDVIVCVNKVDNERLESMLYEFYSLGYDKLVAVSALHGTSIGTLLDMLKALAGNGEVHVQEVEKIVPKVSIVGRPNVGKSSLLNRIVGSKRVIVSELPGTTRDLIDIKVEYFKKEYIFVDTPGIRKKSKIEEDLERICSLKAIDSIKKSDVALLLIDSTIGVTEQDLKIAGFIDENYKCAIVAINKWDMVKGNKAKEKAILEYTRYKFEFLKYAPIIALSAKTGFGLKALIKSIDNVYAEYSTRIETSRLNKVLGEVVSTHGLARRGRAILKFYYATQVSICPPTIVAFVNYPELIKEHYERFLKNRLRESLGIPFSPIRLIFRKRS